MMFKKGDIVSVKLKHKHFQYAFPFIDEYTRYNGVFTVLKYEDDDVYVYSDYNGRWILPKEDFNVSLYGLPEELFKI